MVQLTSLGTTFSSSHQLDAREIKLIKWTKIAPRVFFCSICSFPLRQFEPILSNWKHFKHVWIIFVYFINLIFHIFLLHKGIQFYSKYSFDKYQNGRVLQLKSGATKFSKSKSWNTFTITYVQVRKSTYNIILLI